MQCPFCGHENIQGVDQCAQCGVDLADLDTHKDKSKIELDLLHRPLGELMAHDYITVAPELPVREVIRRLNEESQHCAIVHDGDKISGILTERDILNKLAHRFEARADDPVRDHMTPDPETLQFNDPVAFGLNRMMVGGYRHIPIERDGKLAGVVSVRHIISYMVDRFPEVLGTGAKA